MSQAPAPTATETVPTKRAVIYLRVSTAAQADRDFGAEGFSIPAQREACLRTAERLDAVVVDEYVDRGESARSSARPALQAMLNRIRVVRDIDFVIVHKVDRLARSRQDDVTIALGIRQAGAALVSATENIDETPSGQLMHGIMATIAEFYSANLANEARKGMRQKAKAGGTPGLAPFGYINARERTPEGREVRTVMVDQERAPWVKWLHESYATGEWTISSLRDELQRRGVRSLPRPNKPARPLANSHIETILKSRYYLGIVTFAGVEYPGRHEALLGESLWQQVQAVRMGRFQSGEKPRHHPHYLKGTLFCGGCEEPLGIQVVTNGQGVKYDYFYCLGRQVRKNGCTQKAVLTELAEREVERHWSRVELSASRIAAIRVVARQHIATVLNTREKHLVKARATLAALDTERQKLLRAHYADAIPIELLKTEQSRIATEMAAAETLVAEHESDLSGLNTQLEELLAVLDNAQATYRLAPGIVRRQLNQAVFQRLYLDDDTVVGSDLTQPYLRLLSPDLPTELEQEARVALAAEARSAAALPRPERYERPLPGGAAPRQIETRLRQTASDALAWQTKNPDPHSEDRGSNLTFLVGLTGFEPATP